MKTKYRIKKYTRNDGLTYYSIQERFLFFWVELDSYGNLFHTEKEALAVVNKLIGSQVVKTEYINL
jgi:hypothetical protein